MEEILHEAIEKFDPQLMESFGKMIKETKDEEEKAKIYLAIMWAMAISAVDTDAYRKKYYTTITKDNFPMFWGRDAEFSDDERFQTVARGKLCGYVPDAMYGFSCDPQDNKYGSIKNYMYARVRKDDED